MYLHGTTSYLPTTELNENELHSLDIIELTPQVEVWDPHSGMYQEQEQSMTDYKGDMREHHEKQKFLLAAMTTDKDTSCIEPRRVITSVLDKTLDPTLLAEGLLARQYSSNVDHINSTIDNRIKISSVRLERGDYISVVKAKGAKSDLTAERLAKVFGIKIGLAIKTLNSVTRLCPRNASDISLK